MLAPLRYRTGKEMKMEPKQENGQTWKRKRNGTRNIHKERKRKRNIKGQIKHKRNKAKHERGDDRKK
jgi:hypothetical protein